MWKTSDQNSKKLFFCFFPFCSSTTSRIHDSRVRNAFQRQYVGSMVVLVHCWTVDGNKNRAWNVKAHLQVLRIITRCVQCSRSVDEIPGRGVASPCDVRKNFLAAQPIFSPFGGFGARSIVLEITGVVTETGSVLLVFFSRNNRRTNHVRKVVFV